MAWLSQFTPFDEGIISLASALGISESILLDVSSTTADAAVDIWESVLLPSTPLSSALDDISDCPTDSPSLQEHHERLYREETARESSSFAPETECDISSTVSFSSESSTSSTRCEDESYSTSSEPQSMSYSTQGDVVSSSPPQQQQAVPVQGPAEMASSSLVTDVGPYHLERLDREWLFQVLSIRDADPLFSWRRSDCTSTSSSASDSSSDTLSSAGDDVTSEVGSSTSSSGANTDSYSSFLASCKQAKLQKARKSRAKREKKKARKDRGAAACPAVAGRQQ